MKKFVLISPYVILFAMISFSWFEIATYYHFASINDILAIILVLINLFIYFWRLVWGIRLTGIILLLATFGIVSISQTMVLSNFSFGLAGGNISTPSIDYRALLLLTYYLIIDRKVLFSTCQKLRNPDTSNK